jgi:hypothetical protein
MDAASHRDINRDKRSLRNVKSTLGGSGRTRRSIGGFPGFRQQTTNVASLSVYNAALESQGFRARFSSVSGDFHDIVMGLQSFPLKISDPNQQASEGRYEQIGPIEIRFRYVDVYNNRLNGRALRLFGALFLHIFSYWPGTLLIRRGWIRTGEAIPAITGGVFICFLALLCLTACDWSLGWWL